MARASDWKGKFGQVWAAEADAMDRLLGPPGDAGIAALGEVSGARVLDLGCGAGQSSRKLAELGASVVGIDISQDLLDAARTRGGDIAYHLKDASTADLDGPYDALFSRFGSMFFDDPVAGWTHIRHEVGHCVRMSLVVWQGLKDNDWAAIPLEIADGLVPSPKPVSGPPEPGPFAWADTDYARDLLTQAGWRDISFEPFVFRAELSMGDDPDPLARAVRFVMRSGPLASRTKELSRDIRDKIAQRLYDAFKDHLIGDRVVFEGRTWGIRGQS